MRSHYMLGIELFVLFILLPLSFLFPYYIPIKVGITIFGFMYVLFQLKRSGMLKWNLPAKSLWKPFWRELLGKLAIIAVVTVLYMLYIAPKKLFFVMLQKPGMWFVILFIYSFLSVWPQEIIYRTFFYHRYEKLIQNKWLFMFINAILFSMAHIFFRNFLVLVLTFLGGLFFAYTYQKTRSTMLVSVEHAIYGNWLFTVGMGEMLAFPGVG